MTDAFKRGSAPGRARSEDQRPDSFKDGHEKLGGRRRGTPNFFSTDYRKAILEAAYRIGEDANGKSGVLGYLRWVARRQLPIFARLLGSVLEVEELEIGLPQKPRRTVEQLNEEVAECIGLKSEDRTQPQPAEPESAADRSGLKDRTPQQTKCARLASIRKRSNRKVQTQQQTQPPDPESPWAWTGQDMPVGPLMHLAVTDPKEFCTLLQAVFFANCTAAPACRMGARACCAAFLGGTFARRGTHAHEARLSGYKLRKTAAARMGRKSPFLRTT